MKIKLSHKFEDIICKENLLLAWQEFLIGKKSKLDVQKFEFNLADNILSLHEDLANKTYKHGDYYGFYISDPKRRHIHKASVRDRLLHHAVYRILYPFFDKTFISDSFSCRLDKGTHKAINRFRKMAYIVSKNHTKTCWVLKCDIKKFFASINHRVLLNILAEHITDKDIFWLLENIIESFSVNHGIASSASAPSRNDGDIGLPLGNLTSQLFSNIYMNRFDQYIKHKLKAKYYIRYADDFVILSRNKEWLENLIPQIQDFLQQELRLSIHPNKVFIKTYASGVDFLGWNNFCDYRILRKKTKDRMIKRIKTNPTNETLQSYLGLLGHGNTKKTREELLMRYWLWRN
ncbi:reverse transcriptase domain-containing protein [Patescibacteria group bacterium]